VWVFGGGLGCEGGCLCLVFSERREKHGDDDDDTLTPLIV
jgi:hypothetical protein